MKKSIIAAGAASIALAAMPIVGVFAATERDSVTDTINVTIETACTFTTNSSASDENGTYSFTGTNGAAATVTNAVHTFNVFCNDNSGYKVSATATALTDANVAGDSFAYVAELPSNGADGAWHAQIAATTASLGTPAQLPNGGAATDIITLNAASAAGGETFTATYSAYVGTETPAGTYTGTIAYTLSSNS